jgi:dihydroxy-acid dehydratase
MQQQDKEADCVGGERFGATQNRPQDQSDDAHQHSRDDRASPELHHWLLRHSGRNYPRNRIAVPLLGEILEGSYGVEQLHELWKDKTLDQLNTLSDTTPVLVNLKPVGNGYMEDFFAAGGVGALLRELKPLLHLDCMTVTGETLGERLAADPTDHVERSIIATRDQPLEALGGLVALFGNLAPKGAILKRSAADANLFELEGRAVVFSSLEDLAARVDDQGLEVDPKDILVLQNAGPHSESAMPEAGYLPIPKKLATKGVKDMVRISDARMSGTAFGTIILHVTPDSASGGPLGLVKTGDRIKLSVKQRRVDLLVDDKELERRKAASKKSIQMPARGYARLYAQEILGADQGCDFAFLKPR